MRVLLAIGCNSYAHADQLGGAERDAQRVFDALIKPEVGEYDVNHSRLLLSPTYEATRQALKEALFAIPNLESFTFFFAGHGCVSAGAFYMWLQDSSPIGLSMSALSLADIFRSLNEAGPLQSNIIIDACESGGLIEDLGILLKPGLLGNTGTPGLTLVATAAQNQGAQETSNGGNGTIALLDCIEGRDFVQDHKSSLDLVEIGMKVSQRLQHGGQSPVVWGLNLYGATGFCKNPLFGNDPTSALRQTLHAWPTTSNEIIKQNYDSLWAAYSAAGGVWEQGKFSTVIATVLQPFAKDLTLLARLTDRLATTFFQKAYQARDPYRCVEVNSTLAVALLPFAEEPVIADTAQRLIHQTCASLNKATAFLIDDLDRDKYALLSDRSGVLSELHQLPLRISKVLGWASAATLMCSNDIQRSEAEALFAKIVALILEHYGGSVVSFSDAEASGWCIALSTCARLGLHEEGEQLIGRLFHSLIQCRGRLASFNLPHDRALDYLIARHRNDYSDCLELVARPVDLLTVLFKSAGLFSLETVFDESLWKIDGLAFGAYLPADYMQYGASFMEHGNNLVWRIGYDVFKVQDFATSWPQAKVVPQSPLIASLALAASLLYLDRQAWFLFEH